MKIKARNTYYGQKVLIQGVEYTQYDKSLDDNEVWFVPTSNTQKLTHALCVSTNHLVEEVN